MTLFFGESALSALQNLLDENQYSKLFILCDENTATYCLPLFLAQLDTEIDTELIEIEAGEESKCLEVLEQLWLSLSEMQADRHSLVINLGGGVVSDLGGFLAATYMRGIQFVNFPTSLLAMVDASVGSKTGINFGAFKNRIGAFADAQLVGVMPDFLESLPPRELLSGWAEMIKHGLISAPEHFRDIIQLDSSKPLPSLSQIKVSIGIKSQIVSADPREASLRKTLNFGHSLGHALESFYQTHQEALSHGHCVALGMIVALDLSVAQLSFPSAQAEKIQRFLAAVFPWPEHLMEKEDLHLLMLGDKKNRGSKIKMVLLSEIGQAHFDQEVDFEKIWQSYQQWHYGAH